MKTQLLLGFGGLPLKSLRNFLLKKLSTFSSELGHGSHWQNHLLGDWKLVSVQFAWISVVLLGR
jgi:hypothetical protein